MGDPAPIAVELLVCPGRGGKPRGVVEVDSVVLLPWDVGMPKLGSFSPKDSRIIGGCWSHDGGHITCDVGIFCPVDDPWSGFTGVDCAKGLNTMFGVGGPIKCVQM